MRSVPQDLGSSYGLKAVMPDRVEKALKMLGGNPKRVSKGHPYRLFKMPTGKTIGVIATGSSVNGEIGRSSLKDLLDQVIEADLDPVLFLAVVERYNGCTWYRKPSEIANLSKWLRSQEKPLRTAKHWRSALDSWAITSRGAETRSLVMPQSQGAPSNGEAGQDTGQPEQARSVAPVSSQDRHTWATGDVLDLSGIPKAQRQRAAQQLAKGMQKGQGLPGELVESGEAIRRMNDAGSRAVLHFTPKAAEKLAHWIVERYGTPEQQVVEASAALTFEATLVEKRKPNVVTASATVRPVQPAAPVEPEPAIEPEKLDVTPPREYRRLAPATKAGLDWTRTPGEALMAVCMHLDVEPVWAGFHLDVDQTVINLAKKIS